MKPKCQHRPKPALYMDRFIDMEKRLERGEKQRRCPVCKLWFWEAEFRKAKKR